MSKLTAEGRHRRRFGVLGRLRRRLRGGRQTPGRPPDARRRIAVWALAIGLLCGFFDLPLPAEDTLRAARSALRLHPADQSVVIVAVDDRTLNVVGGMNTQRNDDAILLDRLFASGARRVFFDRVYADPTAPAADQKFLAALKRHAPKVVLGAMPNFANADGSEETVLPHPMFRPYTQIASIMGREGPLALSVAFPLKAQIGGKTYRSLSAELAGVDYDLYDYRVDFSIDFKTVPTVSYIDVHRGAAPVDAVRGRDVVVAPASRLMGDYHAIPFRGKAPGAYMHVLGAETLKNGRPINLMWLPAYLVVLMVLLWQAQRPRPSRAVMAATAAILLAGPLALDARNISVDVMPALIALSIAWVRLARLARATYRGSTGLQRIETLHDAEAAAEMDVVALKIRNFATISANLAPDEIEELLTKAQGMLRATDPGAEFAFEKDTLVWLRPKIAPGDREDHIRGLHALFRTSISTGSHAPDVASSIGIDAIHEAPLRERIENAMQCAEDAAHSNRVYMVSERALAADRAWRLEILSELETAIGNGEVELAYQPKFALTGGEMVGAEALLRWHHPTRGTVEPGMVIAWAEEHNRVDMITGFVLDRALSQGRAAVALNPGFKLAVNISALDLRDPTFVDRVRRLIGTHRFPVGNLLIEITETAPIENDATVAATLAGLKRLGVGLSVDDFGMGHASLHYLRQIPADEVKIDRSFVVGMETSNEDRALVRSSIDMIHSLGRTAVAEGVENAATVELLREMGCDTAQGYFFCRPISMKALLARLSERARAA